MSFRLYLAPHLGKHLRFLQAKSRTPVLWARSRSFSVDRARLGEADGWKQAAAVPGAGFFPGRSAASPIMDRRGPRPG